MTHAARLATATFVVLAACAGPQRGVVAQATPAVAPQNAPEVLLRLDDVGMNHSVNMAIEEVAATKMPFSVSVLFVCP